MDPGVALKHMACAVRPAGEIGEPEAVTFLYRLAEGACPKSYGMNVRLPAVFQAYCMIKRPLDFDIVILTPGSHLWQS